MKLRFLTLLIPGLLFFSHAPAQTDSLKDLLQSAKHDTTRCTLLNQLIESENNDAVWPTYNEQLLQLADKNLKDPGPLKNIYLKFRAIAINNKGYLANMYGENDKAVVFYEEALAVQRKISHKPGIAAVLYNLGDMYALQGNLPKALEYLHESLKLHEELKDEVGTAYVLNELGWYYHVQGEDQNAFIYLNQAKSLREKLQDLRGLANTLNNLGLICLEKRELEKGSGYFSKALELMQKSGDRRGEALAFNNLGAIYQAKRSFTQALDHFNRSAKIQIELNDKGGLSTANNNIADVLVEMANGDTKKLNEAEKLALKCLETARQMGFPKETQSAANTLRNIYKALGDYKKAYAYYGLYIQMRDSVSNVETRKASVKKQFQYQYEKKAAADSVRNKEAQKVKDAQLQAQNAQLKQERTTRYALYGGLVLVVIFLLLMFNRFKVTQRQKVIIEEQKKRVDQAFESLHEKNKEVMDSIYYARRIQKALITSERYVQKQLERLRKN